MLRVNFEWCEKCKYWIERAMDSLLCLLVSFLYVAAWWTNALGPARDNLGFCSIARRLLLLLVVVLLLFCWLALFLLLGAAADRYN